ncbi:E3 ubiquitin-protein ligase LRSAM1-like [Papilio machaon]|uniref:E3 ubiquitin-protein ligase LRSAM1-like n=1 Tax=Papilio machaon TaxID=76193 RepID=UPI001E66332F|nr:E3 ubiquitin-protein ligase LRSAM1-like [Papilio machaon]
MGCAVSGVQRATMSLLNNNTNDARAKLERKLYLAKESPEPDFDLSDCELRHLPSGIFSICKVFRKDNLYLQNNYLRTLDHGGLLSDLHLIKIIDLSYNRFNHLSNDIRYLVNLTELHIQHNMLKAIPDGIKYLESLRILDVSNNKLTNLTPSIGSLKALNYLNICQNEDLTELCPEVCLARNLRQIDLDGNQFTFPPIEITCKGIKAIMMFLCESINIEYIPPSVTETNDLQEREINKSHNPFIRQNTVTWEEQEAAIIEQERKIHKANQEQRDKFLSEIIREQINLDTEIAKVHEGREVERQRLIKAIQDNEKDIDITVKNFIQSDGLKPEVIQQQLAYEKAEHDRLLELTRQNYDNIKKSEVLQAMENLMNDENSVQYFLKDYKDNLNNIKENILIQESESNSKLSEFLNAKDNSRTVLVQQLLEDEDVQKALVTSLLEKVDAKTWSLNEEISLISSHLAKLSVIEQEKKKLHIAYNYNELLQQRMQLVNLLDDLFDQRKKRRKQLIETIKEVEIENNSSKDFWLKNYQKLIDSAPKNLLNVSKHLDPMLANYLLQEGVIHCLPFLVKFLFSGDSLANITPEKLKESGVTLSVDRDGILRAINLYIDDKLSNSNQELLIRDIDNFQPTAPLEDNVEDQACLGVLTVKEEQNELEGECVICMDARSQIVFVPCGHMCCCERCSITDIDLCPMCRTGVERKIKVLIA